MSADREQLPDHSTPAPDAGKSREQLRAEGKVATLAEVFAAERQEWADLEAERDRLRADLKALKANQCPDAEVCKTCPCAGEDDACFPGERLRAENERLREALDHARSYLHIIKTEQGRTAITGIVTDALKTARASDDQEAPGA